MVCCRSCWILLLAAAALIALVACTGLEPDSDRIARRVDAIERSFEAIRGYQLRVRWSRVLGEEFAEEVPPGSGLLPHSLPHLETWREQQLPPELARRVEVLYRHALLAVVASDAHVAGLEEKLADGGLAAEPSNLTLLLARREELARELGFDSFYELWLASQGSSLREVEARLQRLELATRDAALGLVATLPTARARPAPHDVAALKASSYAFLDPLLDAPGILARGRATLAALGLPLGEERVTFRHRPRAAGAAGFLAFPVAIPADVRLLIGAEAGHAAQRGALHELGHACFYTSANASSYPLRLPANRFVSEGFAKLFERLVYDPAWLERIAGAPATTVAELPAAVARFEVLRARELLGRRRFELAAYRAGAGSLDELYRQSMERLTFLDWSDSAQGWHELGHLISQPFSSDEYLHARFVQCQLRRSLRTRHGEAFFEKEAGSYLLRKVIQPGSSIDARELMLRATGDTLEPTAYLEDELGLN